jgi:hypothetical protein
MRMSEGRLRRLCLGRMRMWILTAQIIRRGNPMAGEY